LLKLGRAEFAKQIGDFGVKETSDEIRHRLSELVIKRILLPIGECSKEELLALNSDLYVIAGSYLYYKSRLNLLHEFIPKARKSMSAYSQSLTKVRASARCLKKAQEIVYHEQPAGNAGRLKRNVVKFDRAQEELRRIEEKLEQIQVWLAAAILPSARRGREIQRAARFPFEANWPQVPVTPGSAELRDAMILALHNAVSEFTGGDTRAHVRTFIREFFEMFHERLSTDALNKVLRKRQAFPTLKLKM
jgi:hypothetical protein